VKSLLGSKRKEFFAERNEEGLVGGESHNNPRRGKTHPFESAKISFIEERGKAKGIQLGRRKKDTHLGTGKLSVIRGKELCEEREHGKEQKKGGELDKKAGLDLF